MKDLEKEYRVRYDTALKSVAAAIESQMRDYLQGIQHVDRVSARAKDPASFLKKAAKPNDNGTQKYVEPLSQIQDQIGARIVTFFHSDVAKMDDFVKRYYTPIELKDHVPDSESEFGYFGRHYILFVPNDAIDGDIDKALLPRVFELQVKTLFQHAWSEAEHDLGYKPGAKPLSSDDKRRFAFTSAQAWGADRIFDELYQERSK